MKKWIVLAVIAALALTVAPLAMAGHGKGHKWAHGKSKFQLVGKVSAVDAVTGTLTVKVKSGTKTIRAFRGSDLELSLADGAKVRLIVDGEAVPATLADLAVGAKVKVGGTIDRSGAKPVCVAKKVLAHAAPVVVEPTPGPTPTDDPTVDPTPVPDPSATTPAG